VALIIYIDRSGFTGYETQIFHISKLFYEEVEVTYEPMDQAELIVRVTAGKIIDSDAYRR
jgi:hypothetical protein